MKLWKILFWIILKKKMQDGKPLPEYISLFVDVSSCSSQKTVLSFVRNWVVDNWIVHFWLNLILSFVTIWVIEFLSCHLRFWVLLLFQFNSSSSCELCLNWTFGVLSQLEFWHFVKTWVFEFHHNLSLSFDFAIWDFVFCCYLSFVINQVVSFGALS